MIVSATTAKVANAVVADTIMTTTTDR